MRVSSHSKAPADWLPAQVDTTEQTMDYMVDSADGWKWFATYTEAMDYAKQRDGEWRILDVSAKAGQQIKAEGVGAKVNYVKLDYLERAFAKAFGF